MVISHADVFFCLIVLFCRNVYRRIIMMCQAPRNELCIAFVCFYSFPTALLQHCGRRQNDALHSMIHKLMIECKTKAPCLITAYKQSIVSIMETHCLNIVEDLAIMAFNFLSIFGSFFFVCVTTESKRVRMCIHSNVDCAIIHVMTSICMR